MEACRRGLIILTTSQIAEDDHWLMISQSQMWWQTQTQASDCLSQSFETEVVTFNAFRLSITVTWVSKSASTAVLVYLIDHSHHMHLGLD